MKQVTLMDLLDSSIFNTNSLAPTLYLSESDENYLNRENKDKVFSLVKMSEKKKQLKLSSLFKIFSKRKIYDTSYVFEKVVEWCRSKLQFVGENDNRDVIFSTELKNAMGDNPYSNYVLNTLFYSYGYSELIPYKCKTEESKDQFIDETSIIPMVYTAYKLRKSLRGSKWYYRTHPHLSKEIIGDVCVPMAMAVIFNELSKRESIEEIAKEIAINSLKDFIDGEVIYYSIEAEKEEFEKISNILDIKFVRLETDQAQFKLAKEYTCSERSYNFKYKSVSDFYGLLAEFLAGGGTLNDAEDYLKTVSCLDDYNSIRVVEEFRKKILN